MFYKNFINHHKKLLHFMKLKSISEKGLLYMANEKHALYSLYFS